MASWGNGNGSDAYRQPQYGQWDPSTGNGQAQGVAGTPQQPYQQQQVAPPRYPPRAPQQQQVYSPQQHAWRPAYASIPPPPPPNPPLPTPPLRQNLQQRHYPPPPPQVQQPHWNSNSMMGIPPPPPPLARANGPQQLNRPVQSVPLSQASYYQSPSSSLYSPKASIPQLQQQHNVHQRETNEDMPTNDKKPPPLVPPVPPSSTTKTPPPTPPPQPYWEVCVCSHCKQEKDRSCFTKKEWRLKGTCKTCYGNQQKEMISQKELGTHTCFYCGQEKGFEDFHRKEWMLEGKGLCKPCSDIPGVRTGIPPETHPCSSCGEEKVQKCFNSRQWRLGDKGTCKVCSNKANKAKQKESHVHHTCINCGKEKGKSKFHKKQWKLMDKGTCRGCEHYQQHGTSTNEAKQPPEPGRCVDCNQECEKKRCKPCYDEYSRMKVAKKVAKREKRKLDDSKGSGPPSKKRKRERKRNEKKKRAEEKRDLKKAKRDYYRTYGVGYEPPNPSLLQYKSEPLENESLLGTYRLVYYASDDGEHEDIHRTARGILKLSLVDWNGKSSIWGCYIIDTRKMGYKVGRTEKSWGIRLSASFVETFGRGAAEERNRKLFILKHPIRSHGFVEDKAQLLAEGVWWEGLEQVAAGNAEVLSQYCGAALKAVAERHALGLYPDELHNAVFSPYLFLPNATKHEVANEPNNLELADNLMETYRDGSNSWMCRHLNVPAKVAFTIRQYVTPAPVFYVQEGDLVLAVDETKGGGEWTKTLVFRRAVND